MRTREVAGYAREVKAKLRRYVVISRIKKRNPNDGNPCLIFIAIDLLVLFIICRSRMSSLYANGALLMAILIWRREMKGNSDSVMKYNQSVYSLLYLACTVRHGAVVSK